MSLQSKLQRVCLGLVIILCVGGSAAFAQQTATPQEQEGRPESRRPEGRRGGPGHFGDKLMGMRRALRELNLTDEQQQQAHAVFERLAESTRPQREALQKLREQFEQQGAPNEETSERAKQLRSEMHEQMQRAHAEIVAILTPEQRTKLQQMEQDLKSRREERRNRVRGQQENQP
ncbi:MAG TPA: Spy/CpxP family protein refolding chaperone [Pyrinomonadaceae bacterium]|jgi:Spy/CpxP family protein refolding chaperone